MLSARYIITSREGKHADHVHRIAVQSYNTVTTVVSVSSQRLLAAY